MEYLPPNLVGKNVSFGAGPGSESSLCCSLAVTLGKFLDIQASVFSFVGGNSSNQFLEFPSELNGVMQVKYGSHWLAHAKDFGRKNILYLHC